MWNDLYLFKNSFKNFKEIIKKPAQPVNIVIISISLLNLTTVNGNILFKPIIH